MSQFVNDFVRVKLLMFKAFHRNQRRIQKNHVKLIFGRSDTRPRALKDFSPLQQHIAIDLLSFEQLAEMQQQT